MSSNGMESSQHGGEGGTPPAPPGNSRNTLRTLRNGPNLKSILNRDKSVISMDDEVFKDSSHKASASRALLTPANISGQLPAQYIRVRAARQNYHRANYLTGVGQLRRETMQAYPDGLGHIDICNDTRHLACQNVHNLKDRINLSLSANPVTLECLACQAKHLAVLPDKPACIFACDHNFTPLTPARLGRDCALVLRAEDGTLPEIYTMFRDVCRAYVKPNGWLPAGSVVAFGSISHLALYGAQQYAEDLVRYLALISGDIGPSSTAIPYIPIPLGGISDDVLIRDIADLDSWLLNSGLGPNIVLPCSRNQFWDQAANCESFVNSGPRTLFMPISLRNSRKSRTLSAGIALPASISPFDEAEETELLSTIFEELSGYYGLKLDTDPAMQRGGDAPDDALGRNRTVYLGASHTKRMTAPAVASGWSADLLLPRWTPENVAIDEICERLKRLDLKKGDVLVMDLFSNSTYMGTDTDGMAAKPFKGTDGVYHLVGCLEVASQSLLKHVWRSSLPVIEAANDATLLFCLPLPRYVNMPCCSDPGHVENIEEQDYDDIQREGQNAVRKLLESELPRLNNKSAIFNPLEAFSGNDKLSGVLSSGGISIWSEDPVHLARAAYHDVLTCLQAAVDDVTTQSGGRDRIDSIIPVMRQRHQLQPPAPPTPEVASWILGEHTASRGQYRGRGGWAPAARRAWRGRSGRWRPY